VCYFEYQTKRQLLTVGNDRHVTDVDGVVHETTDLAALVSFSSSAAGDAERTSSTVNLTILAVLYGYLF
jgi:hypothetical protein